MNRDANNRQTKIALLKGLEAGSISIDDLQEPETLIFEAILIQADPEYLYLTNDGKQPLKTLQRATREEIYNRVSDVRKKNGVAIVETRTFPTWEAFEQSRKQ